MRANLVAILATMTLAAGCGEQLALEDEVEIGIDDGKADKVGARLTYSRASNQDELALRRKAKLQTGTYEIHNIDVGTGLAVLVRGSSFNLLFDGGSGDDKAAITSDGKKNGNRLVAYLFGALGPSGPRECTPDGDKFTRESRGRIVIDHLFLSHAHDDHVSLLPDVLHCYDVRNVWEPGAVATTEIYAKFISRLNDGEELVYHTAAAPAADKVVRFTDRKSGEELRPAVTLGRQVNWVPMVEYKDDAQVYNLNEAGTASFKILHANGTRFADANQNSMVIRLDLSGVSMLLVGDAESGERATPDHPADDVEKYLLDTYREQLDVDIHQVGHHGSLTSSRNEFLDAVSPALALIGAGPKEYSGTALPDNEIIQALGVATGQGPIAGDTQPDSPHVSADSLWNGKAKVSTIVRTDQSELYTNIPEMSLDYASSGCVGDRIGIDSDAPGGCDNYILSIKRAPRTAASAN